MVRYLPGRDFFYAGKIYLELKARNTTGAVSSDFKSRIFRDYVIEDKRAGMHPFHVIRFLATVLLFVVVELVPARLVHLYINFMDLTVEYFFFG